MFGNKKLCILLFFSSTIACSPNLSEQPLLTHEIKPVSTASDLPQKTALQETDTKLLEEPLKVSSVQFSISIDQTLIQAKESYRVLLYSDQETALTSKSCSEDVDFCNDIESRSRYSFQEQKFEEIAKQEQGNLVALSSISKDSESGNYILTSNNLKIGDRFHLVILARSSGLCDIDMSGGFTGEVTSDSIEVKGLHWEPGTLGVFDDGPACVLNMSLYGSIRDEAGALIPDAVLTYEYLKPQNFALELSKESFFLEGGQYRFRAPVIYSEAEDYPYAGIYDLKLSISHPDYHSATKLVHAKKGTHLHPISQQPMKDFVEENKHDFILIKKEN